MAKRKTGPPKKTGRRPSRKSNQKQQIIKTLAGTAILIALVILAASATHYLILSRNPRQAENKNAVNILGTTFCNEMRGINEKNNENIKLDLKFRYDNIQNLIHNSDHAPFLRKGIPSILFSTGLHPDLHQPGDDMGKLVQHIERNSPWCRWRVGGKGEEGFWGMG